MRGCFGDAPLGWERKEENGGTMTDCRKCQRFSACYFDNDDCIGFVPKTLTNADRIRAMTDEELAEWMDCDYSGLSPWCRLQDECPHLGEEEVRCYDCMLEWLKKEVDSHKCYHADGDCIHDNCETCPKLCEVNEDG